MCLCNISDLVMFLFFFFLSPVVHTWLAAPLKSVFSAGKLNKIYNSYIWPRFYFLTEPLTIDDWRKSLSAQCLYKCQENRIRLSESDYCKNIRLLYFVMVYVYFMQRTVSISFSFRKMSTDLPLEK